MKKTTEDDDFLKRLEEAFNSMLDEIDASERIPMSIDISINLCPLMFYNSEEPEIQKIRRIPVDIIETEKKIYVVAGLQGVDERAIRLSCDGFVLEITADNAENAINETIELPARVNKTGMKTTYEKGILEVVFNKSKKRRAKRING